MAEFESEFDWDASVRAYWLEHGSLGEQSLRIQLNDKRERRREMNLWMRAVDWLLEALFPRWYRQWPHVFGGFAPMRLICKNGSPSNLFVKHPLPRFVPRGGNESIALK